MSERRWIAPVNARFNAKVVKEEAGDPKRRGDVLLFWGGVYSQWYPSRFTIDGVTYSCAEQYMMASKAQFFGDSEGVANILSTPYPKSMKEIGRGVPGFDQRRWNGTGRNGRGGIARDVIFAGNVAKFSQDPALRTTLLATGDAVIGEASPRDPIYGIGFAKTHRGAWDPKTWTGWNWLGRCLMDVREALRAGRTSAKGPVKVVAPAIKTRKDRRRPC